MFIKRLNPIRKLIGKHSVKSIINLFKQINWQLYNEGTGVPSLSKSTIENIKVRIPSIVQQYKICYILDSYEDKIKNEGLILDLYCSQKQYLLRQMFV